MEIEKTSVEKLLKDSTSQFDSITSQMNSLKNSQLQYQSLYTTTSRAMEENKKSANELEVKILNEIQSKSEEIRLVHDNVGKLSSEIGKIGAQVIEIETLEASRVLPKEEAACSEAEIQSYVNIALEKVAANLTCSSDSSTQVHVKGTQDKSFSLPVEFT